ncbi:E3 ubiquitin-protein ligase TRIM39-like isoform X4 [Polyodon spathula]|uniref:E3 ubiquitin-protein ligase TRIM39-like isoform X4 n=1 Tax=Polyodon spathula TaxID=7913 RepID=UPI001B7D90F8|nr:E3 ubiquitin-protein ligase TRIM39-like isoform X4 [Polyodon spathula]
MAPLRQLEVSPEAGVFAALPAFVTLVIVILFYSCCKGSSKSKNQRVRKENETLLDQNEKQDLQKKNETLEIEKQTAQAEKQDLQKKNETLEIEKQTAQAEKKALQKENERLGSENERLGKEKQDLQKKNDTLEIEKQTAQADLKELRQKTNTVGYVFDREWKLITEHRVKVTPDPDTASPSLTVSEDGSLVRFTGKRSEEWPSVVGREGFTSGRCYWEVEVGEKGYWVLGVSTHPHEKSIPAKPEEGYWLVRLVKGKTCTAVSQSGDQIVQLEKICKVWGVYLDHEGGRLSFYNAGTRFHIYTFEGSFPGQVYPIFSPGSYDKGPLIINVTVNNV